MCGNRKEREGSNINGEGTKPGIVGRRSNVKQRIGLNKGKTNSNIMNSYYAIRRSDARADAAYTKRTAKYPMKTP